MSGLFPLGVLALIGAAQTGCVEYKSRKTYFEGLVLAEYHQRRAREHDDTLTLTFSGAGRYDVRFSHTPGKSDRGVRHMPADFSVLIDNAPEVKCIRQFILPDFLTVTITHNGETESQSFD